MADKGLVRSEAEAIWAKALLALSSMPPASRLAISECKVLFHIFKMNLPFKMPHAKAGTAEKSGFCGAEGNSL